MKTPQPPLTETEKALIGIASNPADEAALRDALAWYAQNRGLTVTPGDSCASIASAIRKAVREGS